MGSSLSTFYIKIYLFALAPNLQAADDGGGMTIMYVMMAWIVAAVLLYMMRQYFLVHLKLLSQRSIFLLIFLKQVCICILYKRPWFGGFHQAVLCKILSNLNSEASSAKQRPIDLVQCIYISEPQLKQIILYISYWRLHLSLSLKVVVHSQLKAFHS